MITEEQLLELGFKRVDPEWDDEEEFHFFLLDITDDLYLMTNCSDEEPAFMVDRLNEVKVNIREYEALKKFIEFLHMIL